MTIRPKTFIAVRNFSCAGASFAAGDVVAGVALSNVLRFGGRFVEPNRAPKPAAQVERPKPSAAKADWYAYALAHGADPATIADLKRDELAALYEAATIPPTLADTATTEGA